MSESSVTLSEKAKLLSEQAELLAQKAAVLEAQAGAAGATDPFVYIFTIFVLACFVGYYVVWKVTPALHTPLMAVTNAVSSIIIVGAVLAVGVSDGGFSQIVGFVAVVLASINIFGGFVVTQRMLGMFKKRE